MRSIQRFTFLLPFAGLLVTLSTSTAAEEGAYSECMIEYHIRHKAQPGKHTDTGPFMKQFTACVRDLNDCNRRGMALVRAKETVFVPEGEGEVPDLNSIRISNHRIEGHCSELDG